MLPKNDLKECPFCRTSDLLKDVYIHPFTFVKCGLCFCQGPTVFSSKGAKFNSAHTLWNDRGEEIETNNK